MSEVRVFELDDATGWRALCDEHGGIFDATTQPKAEAMLRVDCARKTFQEADNDYMRRLNDPDGYMPTHSGPGRLQWLQAVSRMERAADDLRAARAALAKLVP